MKIITQKVIHALDGHQCVDIDELNTRIRALVDAINTATPFRNQDTSRREVFNEFERDQWARPKASYDTDGSSGSADPEKNQ
ncbi:hypothetical protein [Corynebacterium aquatimens]|uniref:Transposase n=1 Tax=Corynebacterium aquatimens TaxID=1190508 RepID=A0A931E014_9CORY|nr:hypothetical protein [Corynebacterium aquatimens]MBG6122209.1 hypothetical protein [Corynebacterium aquatimens]WJY65250.1 hypothetical protein CAQUA_02655 [Corynebacterium aquatimens]